MKLNFKEGSTYLHKNLKLYEFKGLMCGMYAFKPLENNLNCECILFDLSKVYDIFKNTTTERNLEKHLEGQAVIGYKNFKRFKNKSLPVTAIDRTNNKNNISALSIQHYLSGRSLEDNSKMSDIGNLEIKAKIKDSHYYGKEVTMFTLNPKIDFNTCNENSILNNIKKSYRSANTLLRETFGYNDSQYKDTMILNMSINCNEFKLFNGYYYKLEYNDKKSKFYYHIKDKNQTTLSNDDIYYDLKDIIKKFEIKSKNLMVVNYEKGKDGIDPMLKMVDGVLYSKIDY